MQTNYLSLVIAENCSEKVNAVSYENTMSGSLATENESEKVSAVMTTTLNV
jgi:hypothetical protein